MVEQVPVKDKVAGSSPAVRAKIISTQRALSKYKTQNE